MKRIFLLFFLLPFAMATQGQAKESCDSVRVFFRQGSSTIQIGHQEKSARLESFIENYHRLKEDSSYRTRSISVISSASPEGSSTLNLLLSKKRAEQVISFMSSRFGIPHSSFEIISLGVDWQGLASLVLRSSSMPYRREVLDILENVPEWITHDNAVTDGRKKRLMELAGGQPWRYMEKHLFPWLRVATIRVCLDMKEPVVKPHVDTITITRTDTVRVVQIDTVYIEVPRSCKPFYMAIKTNLLYDAALVPNVGIDFYIGKNWSIAANWMYTWWYSDKTHRYWQTYGGDIEIRRWFGKAASLKPLTGWHLGLYGQMLTYDIEFGGKGYQGATWHFGGGLSIGHSLPLYRRLNLDFTLGIGYLRGKYKEYIPKNDYYLWQATKKLNYFGPTKAEVSLVWLIGCGNYNREKGGKQ